MAPTVLAFKVIMDDGAVHEGKMGLPSFVAIERKFNISATALQVDPRIEYTLFGAYHALSKNGNNLPPYDDFIERVADFEVGGGLGEERVSTAEVPPT